MRGFPLLQVLGIVLLFALAGVPVWKLTRPVPARREARARGEEAIPEATQVIPVDLHFAPAPKDFQLTSLGKPVLTGQGPGADFSGSWRWEGKFPPEGADLALQVNWLPAANKEESGNVAARVTVHLAKDHPTEQTFWGGAGTTMVEILTVKP